MATLDANVLVRFLVADDLRQFKLAKECIASVSDCQESLFVPLSVLEELEWVLRSRYEFGRQSILEIFADLLEVRELQFQEEALVERALYLYCENNVDFADCLHLASAITNNQTPLITFDRKAARLEGALLSNRKNATNV